MRGLAGLLLTAGLAAGQTLPPVTVPAVHTQPGSQGWPTEASPTVPPGLPSGQATAETRRPGSPLPQYPSPTATLTSPVPAPGPAELGYAPLASRPLPGSTADDFAREYAERERMRSCDYLGNRYSLFPTSLLWAPPLADKRAPRLAAQYSDVDALSGESVFDTSLGTTLGLLRADLNGLDGAVQLDVFGVALGRFEGARLGVADFRGGVPLTFRRGDWFAKLAYEHTSSYLGDGLGTAFVPFPRPRYQKDEVVVGLGRWFGEDQVRVYGQAAYAFGFTVDGLLDRSDDRRGRYTAGVEWFPLGLCNGLQGQPFLAVHADFRGETDYDAETVVQGGWLWRNPLQRLASVRVFAEYHSGPSVYGQFYQTRENYFGIGLAGDY